MRTRYEAFLKTNKTAITERLKQAYREFRADHFKALIYGADFGIVIIPLVFLGYGFIKVYGEREGVFVSVIGFVLIGLLLYLYLRHVINIACIHFFEQYRYREVIRDYLMQTEAEALETAAPGELANLTDFFEFCRVNMPYETFRYRA